MIRLFAALLLSGALAPTLAIAQELSGSRLDVAEPAASSEQTNTVAPPEGDAPLRFAQTQRGKADDVSAKDAFAAAKELGTIDAWNAFLASYPKGFYADLARAYVKNLAGDPASAATESQPPAEAQEPAAPSDTEPPAKRAPPAKTAAPEEPPTPVWPPAADEAQAPSAPPSEAPAPEAPGESAGTDEPAAVQEAPATAETAPSSEPPAPAAPAPSATKPSVPAPGQSPPSTRAAKAPPVPVGAGGVPSTDPAKPAVPRGGLYMGFPEKFNRYYTDPSWKASRTVFVSPKGGGDGASPQSPTSVKQALDGASPGTRINFLRGAYQGCFELGKETSGTYDQPVVLFGERDADGAPAVTMSCCKTGRQTCLNLEQADYVAIDGLQFTGGSYGVRAVGAGYPASEHSRGVAVMNCKGAGQDNDPFFTGQSDWFVIERSVGSGAKKGDGHGIYISNGSDWNIVRYNETFGNDSSDFQINADPASTCQEVKVPFDDPRCHAYAGEGEGGQGASDYFLVDSNFFHHSLGPGANFASVRRSLVRNNIFGLHRDRHNVSFYNESDSAKLGSSDNRIVHNLFVTNDRHGVKFDNNSVRNLFENNLVMGVRTTGGKVVGNPAALLMEVDESGATNTFRANLYVAGKFEGREPNDQEGYEAQFSATWFKKFPTALGHDPNDFAPTAKAPFLGMGERLADAPTDRNGTPRPNQATIGPFEPR